jgi:hypothetical protein
MLRSRRLSMLPVLFATYVCTDAFARAFEDTAETALASDLIARGDEALARDSAPFGAVIFYEEARGYANLKNDWRALFSLSQRYASMPNSTVAVATFEEAMAIASELAEDKERSVRCKHGMAALEAGFRTWNSSIWQMHLEKDDQLILATLSKQAFNTWSVLRKACFPS